MQLALIGLGRMGQGLTKRLLDAGHDVVTWNRSAEPMAEAAAAGATTTDSPVAAARQLTAPRVVWVMLPSVNKEHPDQPTVTDDMLHTLLPELAAGDILIDGGNSRWTKSQQHADWCAEKGVRFLDIGTSGGILGPRKGYATMVGGDESAYHEIEPILKAVSPPGGYGYFGPAGAGHYVKMVHNAIEYGMMQAFAEGMNLLEHGDYAGMDLAKVAEVWNAGSIVQSLLSELLAEALAADPHLTGIGDAVDENGEGQWAAEAALAHKVPFLVNTAAVYQRHNSKGFDQYANKTLAILRAKFGGHATAPADQSSTGKTKS